MIESVDVEVRALGGEEIVKDGHGERGSEETKSSFETDGELEAK